MTAAVTDQEIVGGYRDARARMLAIVAELDESSATRPVPACPDWVVRDLLAHVTGIASDLTAGNRPRGGDTQTWLDAQVADRRERSLAALATEWRDSGTRFETMIEAASDRLWGLAYDTVVHEHDLRGAIGRPGGRDEPAVRTAALLGMRILEGDLASRGLPAFRLVVDGEVHVAGEGEPALTLATSWFEALRLLGSRRTTEEMAASPGFSGDLAGSLRGLVHMDLPVASLGESTLGGAPGQDAAHA